jgi:hypothetical protein
MTGIHTEGCVFWSTKAIIVDHLATSHQLKIGNPPRGWPPKVGNLPSCKQSAQARIGKKNCASSNFGLKIWKNKKAKMVQCFRHVAKDKSTLIATMNMDYQLMYYCWRYDPSFLKIVRNTWLNMKQSWMDCIAIENDPSLD